MDQGYAREISGKVAIGFFANSKNIRYKLTIEDIECEIPETAKKVFSEGTNYRVYFAPNTKTILSAERL